MPGTEKSSSHPGSVKELVKDENMDKELGKRESQPTIKVKENAETEFLTSMEKFKGIVKRFKKEAVKDSQVSILMSLKRDVISLKEDVEGSHDTLRATLKKEVPQELRIAVDNVIGDLNQLEQGLEEKITAHNNTTQHPTKSRHSRKSRKSELALKASQMKLRLEEKKIQDEQRRVEAEFEAKRRAMQLQFETQMRDLENKMLEQELLRTEAMMSALMEAAGSDEDDLETEDLDGVQEHMRALNLDLHKSIDIRQNEDEKLKNRKQEDEDCSIGLKEIKQREKDLRSRVEEDPDRKEDGPVQTREASVKLGEDSATLNISKVLQDTINLSKLPSIEPFVFDGNILQFPFWKATFSVLIENRGIDAKEKIHYLRKYLAGDPKKAVDGLFFFNNEEAFSKAMEIIERRYGNPFFIAEAFRDKIDKWEKISTHDHKAVQNFADFLLQCSFAITQIPSLEILNDCRENRKMMSKLPDWLNRKWSKTISVHTENGSYPSFEVFVEFLLKEASVINNPLTMLSDHKPKQAPQNQGARTRRVLAVQGSKEVEKVMCHYCDMKNHKTSACGKFAKITAQERNEFLKKKGICFGCLNPGHKSKDCANKATCEKCSRRHPTILCGDYQKLFPRTETQTEETPITSFYVKQHSSSSMIVPVYISHENNPENEILVYALLDTQSDTSFILNNTLEELGAPSIQTVLRISTLNGTSREECKRVDNLMVRSMDNNERIQMPTLFSKRSIPANLAHIPSREANKKWPHLETVPIPDQQDCEVGLLIGYNCPQALAPLEVRKGTGNQPFAVKTELGWSVVGMTNCEVEESISHRVMTQTIPNEVSVARKEIGFVFHNKTKEEFNPSTILKALELDFKETTDQIEISQEDLKFLEIVGNHIEKNEDGYYEMPLPMKQREILHMNSESSRRNAEIRLRHLRKKLEKGSQYTQDYKKFMEEMIDNGDAEQVPQEELMKENTWYLPHHGVYHPKKPTKLRVVFDCSSRSGDTCLNDHLLQGPEMMNSLIGVLCKFRSSPIAVTGDIQRMFHQFRVSPKDQDYLRFLWWPGGNTAQQPKTYRMKVHLFGATSSPGCANFGLKKIATENENTFPEASQVIKESFYVDDALCSFDHEEEAIKIVNEVRKVCATGNLRLHKFISNNKNVMKSIPESEHASDITHSTLDQYQLSTSSVLGVMWNVVDDIFLFDLKMAEKPMTRRSILSIVASIYDPLGFLAPFVLIGKLLLQELCQRKINWDEELCEDIKAKWVNWIEDTPILKEIKINRCILPNNFGETVKMEYHHFSDASSTGYGMCTYLRAVNTKGEVHCSLIIGKARVAPLKIQTIPRLELTAALITTKVSCFLKQQLKHNFTEHFWTDSKIVLSYINNDAKRFHVFVANRIQQIKTVTKPEQWHYVPTDENPADHASRGLKAQDLLHSNWLSGPKFLWNLDVFSEGEAIEELSREDPEVRRAVSHKASTIENHDILERLNRFSSWSRATQAFSKLLAYIFKKKNKELVNPIQKAESRIIQLVQENAFEEEIEYIRHNQQLPKGSKLSPLNPFIDEYGVLRIGGRIRRSNYMFEMKHPAILPKSCHVSLLIAKHYHEKIHHQGRGMTMNSLRSAGYWIIGASALISSILYKCVICRRLRGKPATQLMADLPVERLENTAPFTHCGLDCFGPFMVQECRRILKRYGLIITCLSSRSVHIEVLDDMTTDCFLNGLRCLISIRGTVSSIWSDQGSNFVGATNELNETLKNVKSEKLKNFLEANKIEFHMKAPHSSHMGGVWERQIRTIRSILSEMMHQFSNRIDTTTLRTFMYEAMAIINSRPLSPQNLSDPHLEPLTPNHLLMMKSKIVLHPPGDFVKEDMYARKRWKKVQYLAQEFWNRWRKEYVMLLQQRSKWTKPKRNIKKGDIVLLKDEVGIRGYWKLARIIEANPDQDGLVRKVKLMVGDSSLDRQGRLKSKPILYERPIHTLVLLMETND